MCVCVCMCMRGPVWREEVVPRRNRRKTAEPTLSCHLWATRVYARGGQFEISLSGEIVPSQNATDTRRQDQVSCESCECG